jgi:general stress protein CsbA
MRASLRRKLNALGRYLLARAQEGSTWRGLALIASVLGASLKPEHTEAFVLTGLAASGVIGALFPERKDGA